jgi:ABC-type lipoprotein release transport system permease subunit
MSAGASGKMLLQIGLRSLSAHKVKSVIIGVILTFGTFLLTFMLSMFDNIRTAMESSITGSMVGNLQVMSDKAKDDLAFFGPAANGYQDLGVMENFVEARAELNKIPNVAGVVPMGRDFAMALGGNLLDEKLTEMREAAKAGDLEKLRKGGTRIRQLAELLKEEYENKLKITSKKEEVQAQLATLERVLAPEFWTEFDQDPIKGLDFLDTKLAPLQSDANTLFLPYLGTDLDLFEKTFEKFKIVDGTRVPSGHRGLLLSKTWYEEQAKNSIARQFDILNDAIHKDSKRLTDDSTGRHKADPKMVENVKRLARQSKRLMYELGPDESAAVQAELQKKYGTTDDLKTLLTKLLTVDHESFDDHYKTFYDVVAPRIRLHNVKIGDTMTLRVFTRSGYTRAANIKVYGTFKFDGLDGSLVAAAYSLVDIMTFRDLYGLMTPERKKELEEMRKAVGVKELSNTAVTDEDIFGGADSAPVVVADAKSDFIDVQAAGASAKATAEEKTFTQSDVDNGVVVHSAIVLKNGKTLKETIKAITQLSDEKKLGLKLTDWEHASGIIGQMIWVFRIVLALFFTVTFIVILAVINNAMLMATKDRVIEIGTMRAIGAQRNFVLSMILLETVVLWAISAAIGLIGASALLSILGTNGIPAGSEPIMIVLFGGPKLFPHLTGFSVVFSILCIGLISLLATLYPAWSATRVPPIVAMQRRE